MLVAMVRRLFGYVRFRMIGRGREAFLNAAAARGIPLWAIRKKGPDCGANAYARDYRTLARLARENGIRLRTERKYGLPFCRTALKRRPGIAAGLAVFLLLQMFLASRVWQIRIVGNDQVPTEKIVQAAAEQGIRTGMIGASLDIQDAQLNFLRQLPELSWVAVNRLGSRVTIEVRERQLQPEIIPADEPCNIKARLGGVIVRAEAEDGFAVVREGDVVQAGDLLVEGMRTDSSGATVLHHAHGRVLARTTHVYTVTQPLIYSERVDTGYGVTRRQLAVLGVALPLSWTAAPSDGLYRRSFSETPVMLGGFRLPVSVYTETWMEQRDEQRTCTEEEAQTLARAEAERQMQAELTGAEITAVTEQCVAHAGVVTVTLTASCVEDIGVQQAIYLDADSGDEP